MVTPKLPPLRENLQAVLESLRKCENLLGDTKLENCDSMEVEMRNGDIGREVCKRWRGGWTTL